MTGFLFKEIAKPAGWLNEKTLAQFYDSKGLFKLFIWMRFTPFYMHTYIIYGAIYTGNIYIVLIMQETMLIILAKILD